MKFLDIIRFVQGYVEFETRGEFPERLFNILSKNNITVFDLKRIDNKMCGKISIKDYFKIKQYHKKCSVVTRVKKRHGLPFVLKKNRNRIGFLVGFLLCLVVLKILSSMVWNVTVNGNVNISDTEIIEVCEELGIKEGVFKSTIDTRLMSTKIPMEIDGIAWCAVNIEGVRATIEITEERVAEQEEKLPCNLVAKSDGVIVGTEVYNGAIKVKIGDAVTAGDLLVSGIIDYTNGTSSFEHSSGKVYAKVQKELSYLATYIQTENLPNGKPTKKSVLSFFGLDVPLYLGSTDGIYTKEISKNRYEDNGMYIPITLTTAKFQPIREYSFEIDQKTAEQVAREQIEIMEKETLSESEILSKEESIEVKENGVRLTVKYTCRENIATEDLLLIYDEK